MCMHGGGRDGLLGLLFLIFYPTADVKDKCVRKDIRNFGSELVQMSESLLTLLLIASLK